MIFLEEHDYDEYDYDTYADIHFLFVEARTAFD